MSAEKAQRSRRPNLTGIQDYQIIACIKGGLSITDTARALKCNHANISRRYRKIVEQQGLKAYHAENYKEEYGDVERRILKSITPSDIKKAGLKDRMVSAGICRDKIEGRNGDVQVNIFASVIEASCKKQPQDIDITPENNYVKSDDAHRMALEANSENETI